MHNTAMVPITINWRWGLMAVVILFVVQDLIRKTMDGSRTLLILSDSLVVLLFSLVYSHCLLKRKRVLPYIPPGLQLMLLGFTFIILIQSLNPGIPDIILRLIGIRTYLLYIPAIGLGLFLLRAEKDFYKIYIFLLAVAIPVIFVSFFQAITDPQKLGVALVSMDNQIHSYGDYSFNLISSTFASSKRYGRFLFLIYPYLYGASLYFNKPRIIRLSVVLLFMAAAVISGAREAFVILLLFHAMFWGATSKTKLAKHAIFLIMIITIIITWNTLLNFDDDRITAENYRLKAILSNKQDWKERFEQPFRDILRMREAYNGSELLWGSGIGTYGQEPTLLGDQNTVISLGINRAEGDSGVAKLLVELGLIGFLYFLGMYLLILRLLWNRVITLKDHRVYPIAVAMFFIPLGWLVLFLKAHTVISDGMMSFGLWFAVGFIFSLSYYGAAGAFPALSKTAIERR